MCDLLILFVYNFHFCLLRVSRITDIKCNSAAHISGKIEDGDEIIQINYQTVIGWHYERVLLQLQESPPDVLLTLKKRPRHTKIYGQIYMKPYRLPSKKRSLPYRFGENLPSPRVELVSTTQNFLIPVARKIERSTDLCDTDSSSSSSSISGQPETAKTEKDPRLFLAKPRSVLQRRNTICGDQSSGFSGNITFWHEINVRPNQPSSNLRDKSVSFGFGLENAARPTTCIGIHNAKSVHDKYGDKGTTLKGSLPDIKTVDDNTGLLTATAPLAATTAAAAATVAAFIARRDDGLNGIDNTITQSIERKRHLIDAVKNRAVKFNTPHDTTEQLNDKSSTSIANAAIISQDGSIETLEIRAITATTTAATTTHIDNCRSDSKLDESPKLPLRPRLSNAGNSEAGLAEAVNTTLIKNQNEKTNDIQTPVRDESGKLFSVGSVCPDIIVAFDIHT